jgi:perosamine synthetase
MTKIDIPIYMPDLSGNEKKYVNECIDTSWISALGHFVGDFENAFAKFVGVENATSVCNGTVALHLALLALGIGPGDEVIVPTLTYIATANAVTYVGAKPIFVDSEIESWQIDATKIEALITPQTRAIIPVHLYGQACDMTALMKIADKHNLLVIEDCAEALGTKIGDQHVGSFGHIATFSFFGNKTITTGEGGMVTSRNKELIDFARRIRGQGLAKGREYWHDIIGHNFRMTNVAAAIGLAQLERAEQFIKRKRLLAEKYSAALDSTHVQLQNEIKNAIHSRWMTAITVDKPENRDDLRSFLRTQGIETRPVFYPLHTMPIFNSVDQSHPVAEYIAERGICLPSWPGLSEDQVVKISSLINQWYSER